MVATSIPGRHRSAGTHVRTGGFFGSTQAFHAALCASNRRLADSHTATMRRFDLSVLVATMVTAAR